MPVRSLSSSVLKWPDRTTVSEALQRWVERETRRNPDILKIGYYGSYAKGNWGVGSDIDIIVILKKSNRPFIYRASEWDISSLPVHADLLVYTEEEWQHLCLKSDFYKRLTYEAVWVWGM